MEYFSSKIEIEELVITINDLMESWDLQNTDWMIGKNLSLYYAGILGKASNVEKDVDIHILYDKLPWALEASSLSRSFIPPKDSRYLEGYLELQNKYNIGIDLVPIPDKFSPRSTISKNIHWINIKGRQINFETIDKYLDRRLDTVKKVASWPKQKATGYYNLTPARYQSRTAEYQKIAHWAMKNNPQAYNKIQEILRLREALHRKNFPEIFNPKEQINPDEVDLTGKSVGNTVKKISGKVILAHTNDDSSLYKGQIVVFEHFYPSDLQIAKIAKAIVTSGGGITSHAAIVCREFNIPGLVGVKQVHEILVNGDNIEIDFKKGQINKVIN